MKKICLICSLVLVASLIPDFLLAWECEVAVSGPNTVKLNQAITLSALGTPEGGSYSWSRTPKLVPNGSTATLTGFQPTYSEYIKVVGYYTSPKGKKCSDTKWIWACLCNITSLTGPAEAEVGQEVTLSAQAEPTGGNYTWTINSGTGTLTPSDSSAVFIGDKGGPVEIKVSYVPPEGGEPCVKYHTIQVNEVCAVTLTGDMYQRPVCRSVDFSAAGTPAGGTCSWTVGNGINSNGCNAVYNADDAGYDTVTVTYTTPGGTTCPDSKNVLSYSLDGLIPLKKCFDSGTALQHSDFEYFITPSSFSFQPILSPEIVTTNQSQAKVLVTASPFCDSDSTNEVSTVVDVVNKGKKTVAGVRFEIPNLLTEPLEKLGLAEELEFQLQHNYNIIKECCTDGPLDSTSGETALRVVADFDGLPLIGVPVPKAARKYVTFSAVEAALSCRGDIKLKGEYYGCQATETWSGGGSVSARFELRTKAMSKDPWQYVVIEGTIAGRTDIKENLTIHSNQLDVNGEWGGIVAAGKIKVQVLGKNIFPTFFLNHTLVPGKTTPPFSIDLPSLK